MFRKGHDGVSSATIDNRTGTLGESEKFNLTHRVQTIRDITGNRIVWRSRYGWDGEGQP